MIRIAIHGTGRMASAIAGSAAGRDEIEIIALAGPQPPQWETCIPWVPALSEITTLPDFLIDFTLPAGTLAAAEWCRDNAVPLVSGVTGLTAEVTAALEWAAEKAPVLWSPNLSLGVNLLADLAGRAGAVLGADVPVAIEDIHHQWKKDAPSGTALMLGARVAGERGGDGSAIEYSSVREGEVIGVHTVHFTMDGEEFELVHRARDRSIYALGAINSGCWLMQQAPGMYSAGDWLAAI
ncbi:MAG: 4-hydroxy-tetrahydrodipicolinate reductase [Xanthomonadales bacterium]|jgi:4-hydroxy-tetrahydrodipicolinate reductase|nr:4-hydroxy-tetrahydrodipicolinate reductase [Xanthomonadales bacterium]